MTTFRHLPVNDLLDVTHNFEQLQSTILEQERELRLLQSKGPPKLPEAWKGAEALGFKNAWKNLEAGRKGEYRKNPFGNVELRGVLASGESGKEAFKLPAGYAPKEEKVFMVSAQEAKLLGRIVVLATGAVMPENSTGEVKVFVYLDQVSFSVE